MSDEVPFSVVVPVYNVEDYLSQCLDSLANQTFDDFEVICVNDGSTDSSSQILQEYASKDSRITIINQENKGLSGARNTAMEYVNGKYVIFLDSDDWLENNALEELYNKVKNQNLDIVFYSMNTFQQDTGKFSQDQFGFYSVIDSNFDNDVFSYKDLIDVLFKVPHAVINKMFNVKFLKNINAQFMEGLTYEDLLYFLPVFVKAKKVAIIRKPLYNYRIRSSSISTTGKESSFDMFEILTLLKEDLKESNIIEECLQQWLMLEIVNLKFVYLRLQEDYKAKFFQLLKENYYNYQFDKVEKDSLNKWHFDDRVFYEAIDKSSNEIEFDLNYKKAYYEFLAKHYKSLLDKSQMENKKLKEELANSSLKSKLINFVKS